MSMELSNNVVRKTLTLNLSRAQRCNKKGTHPRPDRTESPVTDAWSGLSRRIFPGIQAQCCQGELESISPAFSRFHRDLKSIDFQPSPINTLPQKSNQDKNTTDVHRGRYIFTNGTAKIFFLVEDALLIGNSTSLWLAIFCLESWKLKKEG